MLNGHILWGSSRRLRWKRALKSELTGCYLVCLSANDRISSSSKNKFVHLALHNTFALAGEARGVKETSEILSKGLDITIVGDNDFYSQRAQVRCWRPLSNILV